MPSHSRAAGACSKRHLSYAYSCRRRCFGLSCHQKRALLFAEHIDEEVLGDFPVRQYVVTIPKMLRLCFENKTCKGGLKPAGTG
jgi:hypothetical protein